MITDFTEKEMSVLAHYFLNICHCSNFDDFAENMVDFDVSTLMEQKYDGDFSENEAHYLASKLWVLSDSEPENLWNRLNEFALESA